MKTAIALGSAFAKTSVKLLVTGRMLVNTRIRLSPKSNNSIYKFYVNIYILSTNNENLWNNINIKI